MRPVDGVAKSAAVRSAPIRRPQRANDAAHAPSRAVIALQPMSRSEPLSIPAKRTVVPFLAHLIATQQGFPQTRERRQRDPEDVIAVYGAVAAAPQPSGGRLAIRL